MPARILDIRNRPAAWSQRMRTPRNETGATTSTPGAITTAQPIRLCRRTANVGTSAEMRSRVGHPFDAEPEFCFWRGASKTPYVHSIYALVTCPDVPPCTYVMTRVTATGRRSVLRIGRVEHTAPSLNLAELRYIGANLGASEIHLHVLAATAIDRRMIELDLRAGILADLGTAPKPRLN
jgi:hypothetical protein